MTGMFSEADLEQHALDVLGELDWLPGAGADFSVGSGQRQNWRELFLRQDLIEALRRINPDVPDEYLEQALAEITQPVSQDAIAENHRIHRIFIDGYRGISYIDHEGREVAPVIRVISEDPANNRYRAINQLTVRSRDHERRFDVVLFVNGMPMVIVEFKRSGSKHTAEIARDQLATYLAEFPMAFRFCSFVIASDGVDARYGTPFTPWNHFAPWNVDDDGGLVRFGEPLPDGTAATPLDLALHGLCNVERFGQLVRDFIAFDSDETGLAKRIAKPHQYFAVTKAIGTTITARDTDGRAGVVWHTQGSGKSMEMELYAAKAMRHPRLGNPTIVVLTDRIELDTQLYDAFSRSELLPEPPKGITSRAELRELLSERQTGGIYFATLQKFGLTQEEKAAGLDHPTLSERRNVIVMADEAHRGHYDDIDGYARHLRSALPNATLIAFTGTPIQEGERDTRRVFGDDIDVYDLNRAVEDGATVPVAFEPRLIKLERVGEIDDETMDLAVDEATAGLDLAERERLERAVLTLDTIYGSPQRLAEVAADIVRHWEARREVMRTQIACPGKAMIVCASRPIAARLYRAITELRPEWHDDADDRGRIKVVYDAQPSDKPEVARHARRPSANAAIKQRVKDPDDELELVIVKDMMLTGFDAPPLHTLYVDRPLKGALLMQTLARVNRTFRGKQDGLLVAYAPLADNLTKALGEFTRDIDQQGERLVGRDVKESVAIVHQLLAQVTELIGDEWRATVTADDKAGWLRACIDTVAMLRSPSTPGNTVPDDPEARPVADRFRSLSARLARAWALARGAEELETVRRDVRFVEELRVWMAKLDAQERASRNEPIPEDIQRLLGELVVTSTGTTGVVSIYEAAGIEPPELSALTPLWIEQATEEPSKAELALEALKASLLKEAARVTHGNQVRQRAFSERVNELMVKYVNQQLTAAEVIAELVSLAKDVVAEGDRGKRFSPALEQDELAFYDVVAQNESAVDVMGEDTLAQIARDLVATMRRDVRTDWTVRDDVKAKLRASIKRLLRKYGYPPDQQPAAVAEVLQQMEAFAPRIAEEGA
ncbi:Type I restriction enzyme EcoR124II R protein [Pseudoclavibacter triregionum]|nr:Type I restriction enzyme EcoR124II R protein [Pseudoclavibacter triregionum]